MSSGILFSKYQPCIFGPLSIKGDTWKKDERDVGDYWFQQIEDSVEADDSEEFSRILFDAQEKGTSFKMDFDCEIRDGVFEQEQLFVVWEEQDVEALIGRLQRGLREGYER